MLSTLQNATRRGARPVAVSAAIIRAASTWNAVPQGPPDAVLGITEAFKADKFDKKILLGVGAYRDDQGKPYVLPSVREAERRVIDAKLNKEYAGITGIAEFPPLAAKLAYGSDATILNRTSVTQSISGTGALRIGADFIQRFYPGSKRIYLPSPSWVNHKPIFTNSGLDVQLYRYYKNDPVGLDFDGMAADIEAAPQGSIFLFHACAHNPTGVDPTADQWKEISRIVKKHSHFVFFDMAYQGFATGDIDRDAFAVRHFIHQGHEIALAQSFAKNMGLYGERVGAFSVICADSAEKRRVDSQLKILIRPMYSSPPIHGARIAAEVLSNSALYKQWLGELKGMADRIMNMRSLLKENLEKLGSKHNWSHITSQIGMFAYTGMTPEDMDRLVKEHSVYASRDGRISVAGITPANVGRLAETIFKVKG